MIREVVLAIAVTGAAVGQTQTPATGVIVATVTDASGSLIPGVTVSAANPPAAALRCVTNVRGECSLAGIPPAHYRFEAALSGFTTQGIDVDLADGQSYRWEVKMAVIPPRGPADLLAHITKLTGPDPIDCGRVHFSPWATGKDLAPALECAADAGRRHKSFWTSIQYPGVDSTIIGGLVGTPDGVIYRFSYDSDPGGGITGPSEFRTERCDHPAVGQAVRFACEPREF